MIFMIMLFTVTTSDTFMYGIDTTVNMMMIVRIRS